MRIVVCDDEAAEVEKLCCMVRKLCDDQAVAVDVRGITNYKRFLEDMAKVRADIVLLDICMGPHNGIEAARVLRQFNEDCAVIFVTSSRDYAVEAFEVTAAHYVIKPVTLEKLQTALTRTRFFRTKKEYLNVMADYTELRVPLDDILYMETVERKTQLHLVSGATVDSSMSLARLSERLLTAPQFFSCYRGIMVNADYVQALDEAGVTLPEKLRLPVSAKRYAEIRRQYHEYLIRKIRSGK